MTTEEKAKAYDEALKIARCWLNDPQTIQDCNYTIEDAIQNIFPVLAKNEDEMIRKELINWINGKTTYEWSYEWCENKDRWIAYLEKLKEANKAIEAVERIDKYIDEHLANAHDMKDSNPDKKYYRGWDDALGKMAGILQDVYSGEKQKEYKTAEWNPNNEDVTLFNKAVTTNPNLTPSERAKLDIIRMKFKRCNGNTANLAESEDERTRRSLIDAIKIGYSNNGISFTKEAADRYIAWLEKQKEPENMNASTMIPSCWEVEQKEQKLINNSTREKIISEAISEKQVVLLSESNGNAEIGWDTRSLEDAKKLLEYGIAFINEQLGTKPEEWSEEDETALGDLLWCIRQAAKSAKDENDMGNVWFAEHWVKNRLKSIRPQPRQEWSEEDEKIYQTVFNHFNSYEKYSCSTGVKKEHVLSWLKSLKPSWKPSKEQMNVLFNAGNGNYLNGTHMQILRDLYNDLKKLM